MGLSAVLASMFTLALPSAGALGSVRSMSSLPDDFAIINGLTLLQNTQSKEALAMHTFIEMAQKRKRRFSLS